MHFKRNYSVEYENCYHLNGIRFQSSEEFFWMHTIIVLTTSLWMNDNELEMGASSVQEEDGS